MDRDAGADQAADEQRERVVAQRRRADGQLGLLLGPQGGGRLVCEVVGLLVLVAREHRGVVELDGRRVLAGRRVVGRRQAAGAAGERTAPASILPSKLSSHSPGTPSRSSP